MRRHILISNKIHFLSHNNKKRIGHKVSIATVGREREKQIVKQTKSDRLNVVGVLGIWCLFSWMDFNKTEFSSQKRRVWVDVIKYDFRWNSVALHFIVIHFKWNLQITRTLRLSATTLSISTLARNLFSIVDSLNKHVNSQWIPCRWNIIIWIHLFVLIRWSGEHELIFTRCCSISISVA